MLGLCKIKILTRKALKNDSLWKVIYVSECKLKGPVRGDSEWTKSVFQPQLETKLKIPA